MPLNSQPSTLNCISPLSFDPLGRLPGEPLAAYATFRRWERDCQGMTQKDAAKYLGIAASAFSVDCRTYFWRARAECAHLGCVFTYPEGEMPAVVPPPQPLPPDLAQVVRQREWAQSLELATASSEALRKWRESKRPPTLADVTRLMELATRLARRAAGMGTEGLEVAAAINNHVRVELEVALQKAYGQPPIETTAEVKSE